MKVEVSTILHDEISEGDMINLSAPVGGFSIENTEKTAIVYWFWRRYDTISFNV